MKKIGFSNFDKFLLAVSYDNPRRALHKNNSPQCGLFFADFFCEHRYSAGALKRVSVAEEQKD